MAALVVRANTHRCAYYPGFYIKTEVTLLCSDSPFLRGPGPQPYSNGALADLFAAGDEGGAPPDRPLPPSRGSGGDASPALGSWFMGNWLGGAEDAATMVVDCRGIDIVSVFGQAYGICTADATWLNQLQPAQQAAVHVQQSCLDGPKPNNYAYVFQSQTQQLLSSMNIPVAQSRKFCFRFRLPHGVPPSFRGQAIRYSYYVWLCIIWKTHTTSPRQFVVKVPFKVWSPLYSVHPTVAPYFPEDFNFDWSVAELPPEVQRTDDPSADQLVYFSSMPSLAASSEQRKRFQREMQTPSNILATNMASAITDSLTSLAHVALKELQVPIPRRRPDPLEFIFQVVQTHLASQNGTKEFIIQNQGKTAATCQVPFLKYISYATHYCIGDTVQGALHHLPNDYFICVKVSIRLECEEKVPVELFKPGTIVATKDVGVGNPLTVPTRIISRSVVAEAEEYCMDCETTHFSLMLPPSQPPSLYTDKVTSEWQLRFEFHYATVANASTLPASGPIQCEDVIRWHQPLHVFVPPLPCKNEKPGRPVYAVAP
eukprot:GGOE01019395.1.p2 GENE.GGOE01019395.1~~GGOE01019395.1.p2  ORF type:complete len:541 (+),score=146.27 GGOE01019395.1:103-1725(+)